MTEQELIDRLAGVVRVADLVKPSERKTVASSLLDLCGLVIALRRRVNVLESRPVLKFRGVWSSAKTIAPATW